MHFKTNALAHRAARAAHLAARASLVAALAMTWMPQTMRAQKDPLVIDNFQTGGFKSPAETGGATSYTQNGAGIYGGTRNINLVVSTGTGNLFALPAQVQVRPQPNTSATPSAFIVSAGFDVFTYMQLYYEGATTQSLNLNLADYNRIRLTFAGLVTVQDFNIEVYDNTGSWSDVSCGIGPFAPAGVGTVTLITLDIPKENFGNTAAGSPVDWSNIELIDLIWEPGNLYGTNNFVLTEVSAITATDPVGTATCGAPAN